METKICRKCKLDKDINEFSKKNTSKDGKQNICKYCDKQESKKWRENNKEKVKLQKEIYLKKNPEKLKEYQKEYQKKWAKENPEKIKSKRKKYNLKNREKNKEKSDLWRKNNPEYKKKYSENNRKRLWECEKKRRENLLVKLTCNIRCRVNNFLKSKNIKKNNKTLDIIGCSTEFLKEHLEKQFKEGMSWDNQGKFGWHIDHIIPLSSANTEEEIYKLCHYTNLQPLWAFDNLSKGNKIIT